MSRIFRKQKQNPLLMVEPSHDDDSAESRIRQRRKMIDELDLIKQRVHLIIQDYEAGRQADVYSNGSMFAQLQTLEDLLGEYESSKDLKDKELSETGDLFSKCKYLALRLQEDVLTTFEEKKDDKSTPKVEEFESAFHNTTEMLQKIKSLYAQMIAKYSDVIESQKLKLQSERAKQLEVRHDGIIDKYTSEVMKCDKLERTITTIKDELNLVKSHNLNLIEQAEGDKLKLQEAECSRKELEEIVKKLRVENSVLKHQSPTMQQKGKLQNRSSRLPNMLTKTSPVNERKNVIDMASLQTKRQAATEHSSKLLDQQLNYMEELMLWGQQNVIKSEKQLSDLSLINNDTLNEKYQEKYTCLCDSVKMITALLGSEGSEKLTAALESAAPEKLLAEWTDQPTNTYKKICSLKGAVSPAITEMKLFIKMKRRLIESSKADDEIQKKVTEVQKWLEQELNGIDREIAKLMELYECERNKVEKSRAIYLDQLSAKVENSAQKLTNTLEKLKIPSEHTGVQNMLEKISTAVSQLKNKPATAVAHEFSDLASDNFGTSLVEDMIASNMPAIDEIRKNAASHLKAKHNVTISSKSWRERSYQRPNQFPNVEMKRKAPVRKHFLPTVATCVDYSHNGSTTKVTSRAASRMNDLLSVQRTKTSEVSTYRANSRNQKSAQVFPTIHNMPVNDLTITGKKPF